MAESAPRWEWRSFGRHFGAAEARFAAFVPTGVHDSDEIYLLPGPDLNVKIRDARLEVKSLRATDADGLEQWAPVVQAAFPLSAADAARIAAVLPIGLEAGCTLAGLLDRFDRSGAVRVHKRRAHYRVDGCMAELSDITVVGRTTRTIAIESADAAAVIGAVRDLGLSDHFNSSYPRALPALIDGQPERYAVIDVGTNSIKLHIAARGDAGSWAVVVDRAVVTRLGEGMNATGMIGAAALERTVAAIADMVAEARQHGVRAIAAVGTAGLRIAANAAGVLATIRARTGVRIEVIPGTDEARLAFRAATAGLAHGDGSLVVFDTGGGSSQFAFGHGGEIDESFSIDVGAARYTDRFGLDRAVSPEVLASAMAAISADLARLDGRPVPDALVGMGGAVTTIAAVGLGLARHDPDVIRGSVVDRTEIDRQIALYRQRDAAGRRDIPGLQPDRAAVILAGACIVRTVLEKLGRTSLVVSDRGLRHGVLNERFGAWSKAPAVRYHNV